jgi:hypothetical protein
MPYIEPLVTFAGEDVTAEKATQAAVQQFNAWSKQNPTADIAQMSTSLTNFAARDAQGQPQVAFYYILTMLIHIPAGPAET